MRLDNNLAHMPTFFYIDPLANKGKKKIFFLKVIFKIACVKNFAKIRPFPAHITRINFRKLTVRTEGLQPPSCESNPSVFVSATTSAGLALSKQLQSRTNAGIQHAAPQNKRHRLSYQLEYWLSERTIRGNFIL